MSCEQSEVIRNPKRWARACESNREAFIYIEKYRNETVTDEETRKFIALFNDLFYSSIDRISKKVVIPRHCDKDDLYQICLLALFACCRKFDMENKEAQFLAYLRKAVRNNLFTYLRVITKNWKDVMLDVDCLEDYPNL